LNDPGHTAGSRSFYIYHRCTHGQAFKLDMEPDPEVMLIGISSHVNDYRLCWSLNRLGMQPGAT
jgi:hypothetical protein